MKNETPQDAARKRIERELNDEHIDRILDQVDNINEKFEAHHAPRVMPFYKAKLMFECEFMPFMVGEYKVLDDFYNKYEDFLNRGWNLVKEIQRDYVIVVMRKQGEYLMITCEGAI